MGRSGSRRAERELGRITDMTSIWILVTAALAGGGVLIGFAGEGMQWWSIAPAWREFLKIFGAFDGVFLGAYLAAWLEVRREEARRREKVQELQRMFALDFEHNANQLRKAAEREKSSEASKAYGDLGLRLEEIVRLMRMESFFLLDRELRDRIRDAYQKCVQAQHLESGIVAATSYRHCGDEAYREPFVVLNSWALYGIESWKSWQDRQKRDHPEWSEDDIWQDWLEEQHHMFYREWAAELDQLVKDLRSFPKRG